MENKHKLIIKIFHYNIIVQFFSTTSIMQKLSITIADRNRNKLKFIFYFFFIPPIAKLMNYLIPHKQLHNK